MKKLNLKKIIVMGLITTSILGVTSIGASAEWKQDGTGYWYSNGSSYAKGWNKINGWWYYFDNNGYMKTGWLYDNGSWYYLKKDGSMVASLYTQVPIEGRNSIFAPDGKWMGYKEDKTSTTTNNTASNNTTQTISNNDEFTRDEAIDLVLQYHQYNNSGIRIGLTGGAKNFKIDTLAEDTIREDDKGKYWLFGMINSDDRSSYLGTLKVYADGTFQELQPGQFFGDYQYEKDYFMKVVHEETDAEKEKREQEEANIAAMRG